MKDEIKLFKSLANETRLRILILLSKKELCGCQLEWALGMSQAKISRHLTVLKNAGMLNERKQGLWVFYSLSKPKNGLEKVLRQWLCKDFVKKYDVTENDLKRMERCLCSPLNTLRTIRKV